MSGLGFGLQEERNQGIAIAKAVINSVIESTNRNTDVFVELRMDALKKQGEYLAAEQKSFDKIVLILLKDILQSVSAGLAQPAEQGVAVAKAVIDSVIESSTRNTDVFIELHQDAIKKQSEYFQAQDKSFDKISQIVIKDVLQSVSDGLAVVL
jgi:hypothetical protein